MPGIEYLSRFLVAVLEFFHDLVRNYGLAIMLLVVVLRAALHPITRWSTRSMLEMQKWARRCRRSARSTPTTSRRCRRRCRRSAA